MFEEGARLKAELGADNVYDFTLGNPVFEPPVDVEARITELAMERERGAHRYMPNAGLAPVRAKVAESLSRRDGLDFTAANVIMTCGAGGALNVIIKALADPGDEVILLAPYFAEYLFYIDNHQATAKIVETDERFQPVAGRIERAIGPKTKIVLLNSPNNPTGAVYSEQTLRRIGEIADAKSVEYGRAVYLVMDEPYRKLVYGDVTVPSVFNACRHSIVATSHSKDLNLPGERIGYIAIHPRIDGADRLFDAMTLCNRILGFVNAPAFFQRVVGELQDARVDMTEYERNRATLVSGLTGAGYELISPAGGFYLFPKSPIDDDVAFVGELRKQRVLTVPGAGFGRPGHFRIAFCVSSGVCRNALPGFKKAIDNVR